MSGKVWEKMCVKPGLVQEFGGGSLQALYDKKGRCSFLKKIGTPERSRLIARYMQR